MKTLLNGGIGPLNMKNNFDPHGHRVGASEFRRIIRIMQRALKDAGCYNSAIYGLSGDGTLGAMEKLMLENQ